jgi:hypothetical protein
MGHAELLILRNIALVVAVTALLSAPAVAWSVARARRAPWPVAGEPIAVPAGTYRDATVRPVVAGRAPWIVYAALLASLMGAAFVVLGTAYMLATGGVASIAGPAPLVTWAGRIAPNAARFALLAGAVAVLRRSATAGRTVAAAVGFTLASVAVYAVSIARDLPQWAHPERVVLDACFYAGGLLLTALLVAGAWRAAGRTPSP